jgi:hypothetical protein
MRAQPMFPGAGLAKGMYESFYLRAVSPDEPLGVWIRHTVHKRPGEPPRGSVWCTVFDARRGAPFAHKSTFDNLSVPPDGWIDVGGQASIGPQGARGSCGDARWSLSFGAAEEPLRHLKPDWLYRAPLPRTKPTSPAPLACFDGLLELPDREPLRIEGWPGMVGHNWGSEHAERWIWLHGCDFAGEPTAWLDLALGRVKLAGRMMPFLASGMVCVDGVRHRLGGPGRRPRVAESVEGCSLLLGGADGISVAIRAKTPPGTAVGWLYADPNGGEHNVVNCSIAALEVDFRAGVDARPRSLRTAHGGVYELGMRERDHGVALAPFGDG